MLFLFFAPWWSWAVLGRGTPEPALLERGADSEPSGFSRSYGYLRAAEGVA